MDYLNEMALFVEVAQANGFSRAAAKLGIPQSTLSRRIAALEDALGLRLFNRSTRRLELTGAGAYYLERALPIVAEARLLHGALDEMRETVRSALRVSLPVDMAYNMVAPLLPEFAARYLDLRVDFDVTPRKVELIGEPFDLAVRTGKLPDSDYIATPLAEFSGCLYAAAGRTALARRFGGTRMPALFRRPLDCAARQRTGTGAAAKPLRRQQPRHAAADGGGRAGHRAVAQNPGARRRGARPSESRIARLAKRKNTRPRPHRHPPAHGERAGVYWVFAGEVGGIGKNPLTVCRRTGYNKRYRFIKQTNRRCCRLKSVSGCLWAIGKAA